jgi:hypothetical protein
MNFMYHCIKLTGQPDAKSLFIPALLCDDRRILTSIHIQTLRNKAAGHIIPEHSMAVILLLTEEGCNVLLVPDP